MWVHPKRRSFRSVPRQLPLARRVQTGPARRRRRGRPLRSAPQPAFSGWREPWPWRAFSCGGYSGCGGACAGRFRWGSASIWRMPWKRPLSWALYAPRFICRRPWARRNGRISSPMSGSTSAGAIRFGSSSARRRSVSTGLIRWSGCPLGWPVRIWSAPVTRRCCGKARRTSGRPMPRRCCGAPPARRARSAYRRPLENGRFGAELRISWAFGDNRRLPWRAVFWYA